VGPDATAAPTALVGREGECRRLELALEAAVAGTATVLVIRGPAGSGKTALLTWARRRAERHPGGYAIASLTGVSTEARLPYAGVDALRRTLAVQQPAPSAAGLDLLDAVLEGRAASQRPADRLAVCGDLTELSSRRNVYGIHNVYSINFSSCQRSP